MQVFQTRLLGNISFDGNSAIEFPRGLPGFEIRRRFVAVRLPDNDPLIFLQSLEDAGLCFLTAPVAAVCPGYRLEVAADDLRLIGLPAGRRPALGKDVLCLTVLSIRETGPTANLLAPIVVNLRNRLAVQAISVDSDYSHQHALAPEEAAVCS